MSVRYQIKKDIKDSKVVFTLSLVDENDNEIYNQSLNVSAKQYLFMNVVKVINTLAKEYNATIDAREEYRYGGYKKYAYFENENDAKEASDWLNGILISNEMKGTDILRKEKEDKRQASYNKRVDKKYIEAKKFEGKKVTMNMQIRVEYVVGADINISLTINEVQRAGSDKIVLYTTIGNFEATFMSFNFKDTGMSILNAGQIISFEIE